jgi:hypothetical protein
MTRIVDFTAKTAPRPHVADPAYEDRKRQANERRKMADPTRDRREPFVFVAYVWSEFYGEWILCGFVRTKRLKTKSLAKLRRKFTIPDGAIFKVQELYVAAACGPGSAPQLVVDWRNES